MSRAFLSYSREDSRWIPLVKRLLAFHHVATWLDIDSIPPGSDYKDLLEAAIRSVDVLLVVVDKGALVSKWVTREISTFKATRPGGTILPLVFDDVPLDDVFDGLSAYQQISFINDLDSGFSRLFGYLGVEFLEQQDRRHSEADRRQGDRRSGDRRRASPSVRFRLGLWKEFQTTMNVGDYEEFGAAEPVNSSSARASSILDFLTSRSQTFEPAAPVDVDGAILRFARMMARPDSELSHYTFREKETGEIVTFDQDTLREVVHRAYRHQEMVGGRTTNIYVVEQVAFALARWFDISPKDRRTSDRRSTEDRRVGSTE